MLMRTSAKVDGKFLKYQSSSGKFVGADASGGSSENIAYTGIITAAQFSGYSHLIAPLWINHNNHSCRLQLKHPHTDTMELEVLMDTF